MSAQGIRPDGVVMPAKGALPAAGNVGADFAALLAAALPEADAIATATAALPPDLTAPNAITPEEANPEISSLPSDADQIMTADPPILVLLPDMHAAVSPGTRLPKEADLAFTSEHTRETARPASLSFASTSGARPPELPASSAAERPVTHMVCAAAVATASIALLSPSPIEPRPLPGGLSAESALPALPDLQPVIGMSVGENPSVSPADLTVKASTMHVTAPFLSSRWDWSFGEQVLWMTRQDVQAASLTLNPPELGPIRVELQLNDAQAVANFSSAHAEVRKAIEDALPALKSLFAEAGLNLRQANVGSGDTRSQQFHHEQNSEPGTGRDANSSATRHRTEGPGTITGRRSRGLLDTFA